MENQGSLTFSRETWLVKAVHELRKHIIPSSFKLPKGIWVSVGWPKGSRKAIGECHSAFLSDDKLEHIFISPAVKDGARVLDILLHEIGHTWVNLNHPKAEAHGKEFRVFMKATGLTGKPTATEASSELLLKLREIEQRIGKYSHGQLSSMHKKKTEKTRMLKLECESCGYIVRTTQTWIDTAGYPLCPCAILEGRGEHRNLTEMLPAAAEEKPNHRTFKR